jgi:hypothetical protein
MYSPRHLASQIRHTCMYSPQHLASQIRHTCMHSPWHWQVRSNTLARTVLACTILGTWQVRSDTLACAILTHGKSGPTLLHVQFLHLASQIRHSCMCNSYTWQVRSDTLACAILTHGKPHETHLHVPLLCSQVGATKLTCCAWQRRMCKDETRVDVMV